ncbi:ankyrin repeat-containing domain protein [Mycena epipterygia]|nr:ankyrin repeat-containing domain protein [Mycena epipterygia]
MPDPFTLAGLVGTALQFVDTIVKIREYVVDFQDAPKDQHDFLAEVEAVQPLLGALTMRVEANESTGIVNGIQHFKRPLVELNETMERLAKELDTKGGVAKALNHSAVIQSIQRTAAEGKKDSLNAVSSIESLAEQQQQDRKLLDSIRGTLQRQEAYQEDEMREKLMNWWSPINFFTRQQDIFNAGQPGTVEWFLASEPFKAWILGLGTRLWCRGIPGAGKTVLVSIVVHHLRETLDLPENTGVAVIYLNHNESEKQSPSNHLASLWRQLVFKRTISTEVHRLYDKHREPGTRPSLDDFRRVLSLATAEYSKVFIVVDGVDEYLEERRRILLGNLSQLGANINLMFTSRPHIDIPNTAFSNIQISEIWATADDIRQYVNSQIDNSERLLKHIETRPDLRQEIETLCVENSAGMFLLAKLHIGSLATKHTVKAVRETLKNMPSGLDSAYDEAMQRIYQQSDDDRRLALSTLAWVANAQRLLLIRELRVAVSVELETSEFDPDNLLDIEFILSRCAGLVIADDVPNPHRHGYVRLVHYTTQDYLDRTQHLPSAETDITLTCITYLSFDIFQNSAVIPARDMWPSLGRSHPLLRYAVDYCLIHAQGQPELDIREELLMFLSKAALLWIPVWRSKHQLWLEWSPTRLWIATFFQLQNIAQHLISINETEDSDTALVAAIANGDLDMMRMLIAHNADVNGQGQLQAASYFDNEEAVALLIDCGADVNLQQGRRWRRGTALQVAAAQGHDDIVHLLLKNGADPNILAGRFGSALKAASDRGHDMVAETLLRHGATVNKGEGGVILRAACRRGHEEVVQLLLGNTADDVNLLRELWTALRLAAQGGHDRVVRLLLAHGADVDEQDEFSGTALQAASYEGHGQVVQQLLEAHANVNTMNKYYGKALHAASTRGHKDVVQMLLSNGADIDGLGGKHGTALQAAASTGCEEVVRLLLANGANVNAQGGSHENAFKAACAGGHMEVVQILLSNGADIDRLGGKHGTALQAAASTGFEEVVHLLLAHRANVNVQGGSHGNALKAASAGGHKEVVQVLVDHGADLDTQGREYDSGLQAASAHRHKEVFQVLLDNGANIQNEEGGSHNNAVQAASALGDQEVVQLLLHHGPDVNTLGSDHITALELASAKGNQEVVKVLLENGANMQGNGMERALEAASLSGCWRAVQLLANGPDFSQRGRALNSSLLIASTNKHHGVVRILLNNGANINVLGGRAEREMYAAQVRSLEIEAEFIEGELLDFFAKMRSHSDLWPRTRTRERLSIFPTDIPSFLNEYWTGCSRPWEEQEQESLGNAQIGDHGSYADFEKARTPDATGVEHFVSSYSSAENGDRHSIIPEDTPSRLDGNSMRSKEVWETYIDLSRWPVES